MRLTSRRAQLGSLCAALCMAGAGHAAGAKVTTFDPTGSAGTFAYAINDPGAITGYYFDQSRAYHGFARARRHDHQLRCFGCEWHLCQKHRRQGRDRRILPGQQRLSGLPARRRRHDHDFRDPGSTSTVPDAINDRRDITGSYLDSNNVWHGFVRAADGTVTASIPPDRSPLFHSASTAGARSRESISTTNMRITASCGRPTAPSRVSIRPDRSSRPRPASMARARSPEPGRMPTSVFHGFVRAADGTITSFDPSGSAGTFPTGIDHAGAITGYWNDSGGATHGFVRSAKGSIRSFDPTGSVSTVPQGVAGTAAIAGYYEDGSSVYHGFLRSR